MMQDTGTFWTKINLLFALLLLMGCETTSRTFKVNAINNPEVEEGRSYRIVSSDINNVDEQDPQFQEVSEYVRNALSEKGFYETPNAEDAELVINIA